MFCLEFVPHNRGRYIKQLLLPDCTGTYFMDEDNLYTTLPPGMRGYVSYEVSTYNRRRSIYVLEKVFTNLGEPLITPYEVGPIFYRKLNDRKAFRKLRLSPLDRLTQYGEFTAAYLMQDN